MQDTYFYHSFPRSKNASGIAILRSMAENGILLTPEVRSYRDPYLPTGSGPVVTTSMRACFTLLKTHELTKHSETFGRYSIEFDQRKLREIGLMPVIYIPTHDQGNVGLAHVGALVLANVAMLQNMIHLMDDIVRFRGETLNLLVGNNRLSISGLQKKYYQEILRLLRVSNDLIEFSSLEATLQFLSGLFYPTEDLRYNSDLGYYMQKEWRLLPSIYFNGVPIATKASEQQKTNLINIDKRFFMAELQSGKNSVFRRVDECYYIKNVNGDHILKSANRIIVPFEDIEAVAELLQEHNLNIQVDYLRTEDGPEFEI